MIETLPDLTPFTNGSEWWNKDSTNALLLISYESNRYKKECIECHINRCLENLINE